MELSLEYSNIPLVNEKLEALVVFMAEDSDLSACGLNDLPDLVKKALNASLKLRIFTGKQNKTQHLVTGYSDIPQVLVVGLGKKEKINDESIRRAAGKAGKLLSSLKANTVGYVLTSLLQDSSAADAGQILVEGFTLGSYEFSGYKKKDDNSSSKTIRLYSCDPEKLSSLEQIQKAKVGADAVNFARTLGNTPANDMTPKDLASQAKRICKRHKLDCNILDENDMKKLGMGMFLGVAKGSKEPARLIVMEHKHEKATQTVAFVGKGVTFDSGGISLKPGKGMDEMKFDMCGAAAVLGAMEVIGALKPEVNVIGVVAATENLPGGEAQRPGDIVTAHNGKKVEILNTDAEGRLILGDTLSYVVQEYKPDAVLDLATLTGACIVALGHYTTAAITNHEDLMQQVEDASARSGERVWQLPSDEDYGESIKGKYGDLQNIGGGDSGTIVGGLFLQHFVDDCPWVHLDIAGTSWSVKNVDHQPNNGATGVGVRLLADLVENWKPL